MSERDKPSVGKEAEIDHLRREIHQLRAAAAESERAKNEYMQNVAHQLAAPINAIKMNIEALQNPHVSFDRKQVMLRSIYAQGTILAHLIKNFSLMSHLNADHHLNSFREKPELVDLYLLCVNFSNDFQPIGKQKEQKIRVNEDDFRRHHRPKVSVIKNLFAQVVYNLLENATKYADEDTEIFIGLRVDADWIDTTVSSEGNPIPPSDVNRIFERGTRGANAKALHPAGTGFGLFIARRIMEVHGGTILVETDHRRTTFILRLPQMQRET